jgi:hypothetical protein
MAQLALDPIKKFEFHSSGGKGRMAQLALDPKKKFDLHSGGGLGQRTPAQVDALSRYLLSAGTPRERAEMIEAFQGYPG